MELNPINSFIVLMFIQDSVKNMQISILSFIFDCNIFKKIVVMETSRISTHIIVEPLRIANN